MTQPVLALRALTRQFTQAGQSLQVLRGIDLQLQPGEQVALVGQSGAGKSTLLQICGLLDAPSSGSLQLMGQETAHLSEKQRTLLRREKLGFVYQAHHLLPEFTAEENVMLPLLIQGRPRAVAQQAAQEWLEKVGLSHRLDHRPGQLSGGEQQRTALARALVHQPTLILMDEPTGNLDPHTADSVFRLLLSLGQAEGAMPAMLMATHNLELASKMQRTIRLVDGKVAQA